MEKIRILDVGQTHKNNISSDVLIYDKIIYL